MNKRRTQERKETDNKNCTEREEERKINQQVNKRRKCKHRRNQGRQEHETIRNQGIGTKEIKNVREERKKEREMNKQKKKQRKE